MKTRKIWVVLLSIFILIGICSTVVFADSITNPGFENAWTGWTKSGAVGMSTSDFHNGSKSAKLQSPDGSCNQTVSGLLPNTTYTLSAWLLGVPKSTTGKIGVRNYGGSEVSVTKSVTSWTQVSVTFTTGSSNTKAEIYAAWVADGDCRVDDFTLTTTSLTANSTADSIPNPTLSPTPKPTTTPTPSSNSALTATPSGPVVYPSSVLNLTNWKLTLPFDTPHAGNPDEITQPELNTCSSLPYFYTNSTKDGVVFEANCGGTTTGGSTYPRSELREMTNNGATNANWSTTSGTHTMIVREAITHLPVVKQDVVCAQIHNASDDVIEIRLLKNNLYVETNGGKNLGNLDTNYSLGTIFTVKIIASGGIIQVYYNDVLKANFSVSSSGCYFKAGCYTQSNTSKGDSASAYGEVVIYSLAVTHQ